jgi:hypothetical protein
MAARLGRRQPTNIYRASPVADLSTILAEVTIPYPHTTVTDKIVYELDQDGYVTGTISDREYARLLIQTGAPSEGHTMMDLYRLAGEEPRIYGY